MKSLFQCIFFDLFAHYSKDEKTKYKQNDHFNAHQDTNKHEKSFQLKIMDLFLHSEFVNILGNKLSQNSLTYLKQSKGKKIKQILVTILKIAKIRISLIGNPDFP